MAILSAQDGLLRAREERAASSRLRVGKATTSQAPVRSRTATTKAVSKVFLRLRTVDSRLTTHDPRPRALAATPLWFRRIRSRPERRWSAPGHQRGPGILRKGAKAQRRKEAKRERSALTISCLFCAFAPLRLCAKFCPEDPFRLVDARSPVNGYVPATPGWASRRGSRGPPPAWTPLPRASEGFRHLHAALASVDRRPRTHVHPGDPRPSGARLRRRSRPAPLRGVVESEVDLLPVSIGRRGAWQRRGPHAQMLEDPAHHRGLGDRRDQAHLPAASRTHQDAQTRRSASSSTPSRGASSRRTTRRSPDAQRARQ